VACCCSGDSGFDGTVMSGINAIHQYQEYFGLSGAGVGTSIVFGIFTLGSLAGTIPASFLPDLLGRRASMWFGNASLIVGAAVTAMATNRGMFLAGRFVTGFGSSCAGSSAKSFIAELSPPQDRGLYIGLLNSFFYVGQITATGMMIRTQTFQNEWSWRLPLLVQMVPAGLNVLFVFFAPESPRWLYTRGKTDQARQILAKLHSSTGDPHSPLIDLEIEEIEEKISIDGADKRIWDFRPLFIGGRGVRYRTYMVIMVGCFGQLSGNGMVTYFLPNLLVIAGYTSQTQKITLNFVNSVTSFIGALTGSALVDYIGRRRLLLMSTGTLVVLLTVASALLCDVNSHARGAAGISMIYMFMVVFSFGWTPMQALYPAEVLPYQSRAKGLAFLGVVVQASSCINTFGLPVAFQKISWKILLIFLFWDAFEFFMVYFFLVETKNITLEEMDEIFNQPNPRKYSVEHTMRKKLSGAVVTA